MGRAKEADTALRKAEAAAANGGAYTIAEIRAYRGERDQAFVWLTRAYEQREPDCMLVKLDPMLKDLRADPRFKAFLRKMKLSEL